MMIHDVDGDLSDVNSDNRRRNWFYVLINPRKNQTRETLVQSFAKAGFEPNRPRHSLGGAQIGFSLYEQDGGAEIYVSSQEAQAIRDEGIFIKPVTIRHYTLDNPPIFRREYAPNFEVPMDLTQPVKSPPRSLMERFAKKETYLVGTNCLPDDYVRKVLSAHYAKAVEQIGPGLYEAAILPRFAQRIGWHGPHIVPQ